jgi:hypothetical protein
MDWDVKEFQGRLRRAVEAYDRQQAAALCGELIAHLRRRPDAYPKADAVAALQALRSKRFFDLLQKTADALIQAGQTAPRVRRLYAQALLDQSSLTAALAELKSLAADTAGEPGENAEACALVGRAYKQLYVDAADPGLERNRENLRAAIKAYEEVYRRDPEEQLWPGINAVALLCRAARDGVPLADAPDPRARAAEIARAILARVEGLSEDGKAGYWDLTTAAEACVALGDLEAAKEWIVRYVGHADADAFQLASTLRQFTEVWQLASDAPIPALLQAELLQREGGFVNLSPREVRGQHQRLPEVKGTLERSFGGNFVSLEQYLKGVERCRLVARLGVEASRGEGTGFLVCGKDVYAPWGDELLLLTNAHVLSPDPKVKKAVRPDDPALRVYFEALSQGGEPVVRRVTEILWTSPPEECDATFARLSEPVAGVSACEVAPYLPDKDTEQHVYIIGHPNGGVIVFSMNDNLLLDYDEAERLIHYRAPTEGGSSGSPVFNRQWQLIGLHHLGGPLPKLNGEPGTYDANEGISIQSIRAAVAATFAVP